MLKILFILPYDNNYRYRASFVKSLSYMPLTFAYLAALTPNSRDCEFKIIDEGVERGHYQSLPDYDIVALTAVTSAAKRAYQLADYWRDRGSYVVLGGHHASLLPDEAAGHCDTVFVGGGDETWIEFINDYRQEQPKRRYLSRGCNLHAQSNVFARRDLMNTKRYLKIPTIIGNYGCNNKCKFCVINSMWHNAQDPVRSVKEVVKEILLLKSKRVLFLDPSPTSNPAYARALFRAITPLKIQWGGLCTSDIVDQPELLELMVESGCIGLLIGFETFQVESLKQVRKRNVVAKYQRLMQQLHQHDISVLGTFMLGFDSDTKESILRMSDLVAQIGIDIPRFAIATPYPNTPFYQELETQGRIITRDWSKYDSLHAVFQPKNMTARELEDLLIRVSRDCYTNKRIWQRYRQNPRGGLLKLLVNYGFKIYNRRAEKIIIEERKV